MPEDIAINGSEAPCLDIRHPVEGIDNPGTHQGCHYILITSRRIVEM